MKISQKRWLEHLWADLRFALHQFRKSPGYTLTAILTLAIGIGANAAIFTLVDDVMLRSLPVAQPERLVMTGFRDRAATDFNHFKHWQSLALIQALHDHSTQLEDISGWNDWMVTVPDDQGTLRSIRVTLVTGNGLPMLGLRPYLGRLLTATDDVPGGPEGGWPVDLDYGFWMANYRADPAVIGRHITISNQPAVIVGVLPPDFVGLLSGISAKLYMPGHFSSLVVPSPSADPYQHPDQLAMLALGRLRNGSSVASLNAELTASSPALMHAYISPQDLAAPDLHNATLGAISASRGFPFLERAYEQPLILLQGIVLLVLLLCCVNLSGLQMARMQARRHEFAVRVSLGAGRSRILQQCLTESLLLALVGSALAALLAYYSTASLAAFLTPAGAVQNTVLRPDARVLLFTTALAIITTFLFGIVPALLAGRTAPYAVLKSHSSRVHTGALHRRIFIPAQFALALVLVLGAGLFTQTLLRLRNTPSGFDPTHVLEVTAQFQSLKKTPAEIMALYRSMTDDLRSRPGVEAVAYTWVTPLTNYQPTAIVHAVARAHEDHSISFNEVGDGYFNTLGTRLIAGREFTSDDRDRSTCILNQSAARLLFSGEAALGDSIKATSKTNHLNTICRVIGLAEDAHYASLRDPAPPTLYLPAGSETIFDGGFSNNLVFMIRARTDAEAIAAYRATLARYAPDTGVMTFLPLRDQVDQSLGSERLISLLTISFAGVALLLSAIGIFGLLALRVQERTPELGVRIAVGATRTHLLQIVLWDALRMVFIGSACGLALAAIGYQFIRRFLYGISSADIRLALASLAVLITVAVIAAAIPARRAASLDPVQALKAE